ncbi:MAG: L,D-transpeptidase [Patescibacteria group bacterium]
MTKRNISVRKKFFTFFIIASVFILGVIILVSKNKSTTLASGCGGNDLSQEVSNDKFAYFEGEKIEAPIIANRELQGPVLGVSSGEKWVEVDLSEQKIKAWEGDRLFLESLVSTGLPWWPTPPGEYRVWSKVRATKMEGGSGKYYYYLPNVPYVMFFENSKVPGWRGFSLHGTYWHNDFGKVHSHGCVNLPTSVAEQLYFWIGPVMPEGKSYVTSTPENPGSRVVIHE